MRPAATGASHDHALDFLRSRIDYERTLAVPYSERNFKLDRMRELVSRLGNPQNAAPIVHLAGTKGKGSTAAMISAVLTAAGVRAGLYSSPHLECLEERFRVDGVPCHSDELADLVDAIRPTVEELDLDAEAGRALGHPTFFEITTAMAWLHFQKRRVDVSVVEVGLGGRLDSTNVCDPAVTVITSISFDHMKLLGNTLAAIAGEKAGIIKPGVPLVCGALQPEPLQVIADVCALRRAPRFQLGRDFDFQYRAAHGLEVSPATGRLDYFATDTNGSRSWSDLELNLPGRHQAANAAVAITALRLLTQRGIKIPEAALRAGLSTVSWPARIEVIGRRPTIILDAAHNVASVAALRETIVESFGARRRVLVFGTSRDKDVAGMLAELLPAFDEVLFTRYVQNPRSVPPVELLATAEELLQGQRCRVCETPHEAWHEARAIVEPNDLLCITGSFFLAAEMKQVLKRRED